MKEKSANKNWSLLYVRGIFLYSLFFAVNSAVMIAIPVLLGYFIDALVYGGNASRIFFLLSGAALFNLILNILLKKIVFKIARRREQELQIRLLKSFQIMKPAAIDGYRNGEIAMKFFRDAGTAGQFISNIYPQILGAAAGTLLAAVTVLYKNPRIALIFLFFLPLTMIALIPYKKRFERINHSIRAMYDQSMNGIFEFMHIFPYLKSMSADPPYIAGPESKFMNYRKLNSFNDRTSIAFELVNRLIVFGGEYSILGVAGWLAWEKMIPVGDVVVFQVLFLSVLNSFSGIFQLIPFCETTQESLRSLNELLNSTETEDIMSGKPIPSASGNIIVRHITFSYPHSVRKIFDDFSCEIEGGRIVALTGINGTGKTTLLKLLTGYLEPENGVIEMSGESLSDWQKKSFREKIASVFQDELLITGTIRENITLKNRKYTADEVEKALRSSGADSLVRRMPDGLEHRIGFEGGGLSGGERQKVAIARALIRQPDILIFDEVTNHLDYESRCKMKDLLNSLRGKTTVLVVSHDPEIISLCDYKIELEESKMKGQGQI